ncbi:hypothetical protein [Francisella philomiragia]|uniref:Putative membrane protein n=1 Tax=Francisella philomiragia TaxID=28110 RepID=A0A0B6D1J1_9GAMM|nr:hypothetical protein [Francisella philomiragia]AJI52751.1 putative membrane protein [Francisella philomiragia]
MSKRLKIIFYVLTILYIMLIIANIWGLVGIANSFGVSEVLSQTNVIYVLAILVITFFISKRSYYVLPICFILMTYWLITLPIFRVLQDGLMASFSYLITDIYLLKEEAIQPFLLSFPSWLIPIVSLVGCIFWYLDVKKSKSLDKHWSE